MRETAKNSSPGPISYNHTEAFEKSSMSPSTNKGGRYYGISKTNKTTFIDAAMARAKKTPAVGKYNNHTALDHVSRPMNAPKNC
jgi:hypothetical protein